MGRRLLLVCFEGLGSDSHRIFSRFVRGSREISPASSLYRESTGSLILAGVQIAQQFEGILFFCVCTLQCVKPLKLSQAPACLMDTIIIKLLYSSIITPYCAEAADTLVKCPWLVKRKRENTLAFYSTYHKRSAVIDSIPAFC